MATVNVLYFASLREQRGRTQEAVELCADETVEALYHRLFPTSAQGRIPVAYAVNEAYVGAEHRLQDGEEVAFIPPVGGG